MLWNQLSKYMTKCLSDLPLPASSESLEPSADRASPKQPILVFHIVIRSGLEHLRPEWLVTCTARHFLRIYTKDVLHLDSTTTSRDEGGMIKRDT